MTLDSKRSTSLKSLRLRDRARAVDQLREAEKARRDTAMALHAIRERIIEVQAQRRGLPLKKACTAEALEVLSIHHRRISLEVTSLQDQEKDLVEQFEKAEKRIQIAANAVAAAQRALKNLIEDRP